MGFGEAVLEIKIDPILHVLILGLIVKNQSVSAIPKKVFTKTQQHVLPLK